ncbi:MAG: division/cell wall cluster transcriptional repressor MraZ [Limnochordia bacterium]|jgi:MraZ protein|nr:division/cell wall cluster transcriptional repressor MraZ [Limnochordia bacterium]MDD4516965.1 division/cell wall cluster transcriptional repressor MraZ [Limnochordia bacterium]
MFMGEYEHTLDSKGRLFIPAKFREDLGETFVATRGLDNCVFVYPMDEWEALELKLKALPLTKADARSFVRFFFSGAAECQLDKQGRIMLPTNLRTYARLEKDVVVIGVSNRVELWSKASWEEYMSLSAESFNEIAEKIVDLGI